MSYTWISFSESYHLRTQVLSASAIWSIKKIAWWTPSTPTIAISVAAIDTLIPSSPSETAAEVESTAPGWYLTGDSIFWMKYCETGKIFLSLWSATMLGAIPVISTEVNAPFQSPNWNISRTLEPRRASISPLPVTKPHARNSEPFCNVIWLPSSITKRPYAPQGCAV